MHSETTLNCHLVKRTKTTVAQSDFETKPCKPKAHFQRVQEQHLSNQRVPQGPALSSGHWDALAHWVEWDESGGISHVLSCASRQRDKTWRWFFNAASPP